MKFCFFKNGFNLSFKCDSNSSCEHVEKPLYRSVSWLLECVSGIQVLHQKYVFLFRLKKSDALKRVMTFFFKTSHGYYINKHTCFGQ